MATRAHVHRRASGRRGSSRAPRETLRPARCEKQALAGTLAAGELRGSERAHRSPSDRRSRGQISRTTQHVKARVHACGKAAVHVSACTFSPPGKRSRVQVPRIARNINVRTEINRPRLTRSLATWWLCASARAALHLRADGRGSTSRRPWRTWRCAGGEVGMR